MEYVDGVYRHITVDPMLRLTGQAGPVGIRTWIAAFTWVELISTFFFTIGMLFHFGFSLSGFLLSFATMICFYLHSLLFTPQNIS